MSAIDTPPSAQEHPFARFIRILGKGKTGSRALSQSEAVEAFGMILRGETDPLQLGAFLMLLRVKEETPEELAGFVLACRENMLPPPPHLHADLDWSSYAGKKHQHPWYILSMLLLAGAGHRVFVHGGAGHTPGRLYTQTGMHELGLPVARDWLEVSEYLEAQNLCYLPLGRFCPALQQLLDLRPLLGLRSPVNTLARLLNPLCAPAGLQSVFHPAYAELHQRADQLLNQPRAVVFKGESGEAEIKPQADTLLNVLRNDRTEVISVPRTHTARSNDVISPTVLPLSKLWRNEGEDHYGLSATLSTAATAPLVIQPEWDYPAALAHATDLWRNRDIARLT